MEKYCNNCGNIGHYYKECRYPILSYGVILYDDTDKNNIKIVMIERKNSLSYIEFLRGKYKLDDKEYIQLLFDRMNNNEKKIILKSEFDDLWKNLWVNFNNINTRIKREYSQSKVNFDILKKAGYIEHFFKSSKNLYEENEWEIPKGRRNNKEKNKCCAIREFEEETNIKSNDYKLIYNNVPLTEEYKGINNVNYKHVYYIGKVNSPLELYIDPKNKDQILEVNSIKWLNKKECLEKIRDYSYSKLNVIKQFYNFIENISDDNIKNI